MKGKLILQRITQEEKIIIGENVDDTTLLLSNWSGNGFQFRFPENESCCWESH